MPGLPTRAVLACVIFKRDAFVVFAHEETHLTRAWLDPTVADGYEAQASVRNKWANHIAQSSRRTRTDVRQRSGLFRLSWQSSSVAFEICLISRAATAR